MKRFLIILVMVSWCSVGYAEKILLTKCNSTVKSLYTDGTWNDETELWSEYVYEDYQAIYNKNDNSIVLYSIIKDSWIKRDVKNIEKKIEKLKKIKPSSIFELEPNDPSMIISGDAEVIARYIDKHKKYLRSAKKKYNKTGYKIISKDENKIIAEEPGSGDFLGKKYVVIYLKKKFVHKYTKGRQIGEAESIWGCKGSSEKIIEKFISNKDVGSSEPSKSKLFERSLSLSCKGILTHENGRQESYFDEWAVNVINKKLAFVINESTSAAYSRTDWYPSEWFVKEEGQKYKGGGGANAEFYFNTIRLNMDYTYDDGMHINYQGEIHLKSGTFSNNIILKKDNNEWVIYSIGECSGVEKLYTLLTGKKIADKGDTDSDSTISGTAFFINNRGNLLTNNHVVEGCEVSKINYYNKEYDTELIATDKTLDLALLKAEIKPKSYISFSKDAPKKRQPITAAGYPLGKFLSDDLKINDGKISALKGFDNNSNEIQHDIPINPGNSGGPIVNENGELVAIAVSGMAKDITEGLSFGIKSSAVENFLTSNRININVGETKFTMSIDKVNQLLEESTVYTFCN